MQACRLLHGPALLSLQSPVRGWRVLKHLALVPVLLTHKSILIPILKLNH
jgi:hypothetical protein